ncbi:MAG: class I SAM-dependent methyltransferase [Deltaproteobacteria bacterium]|nr:class I SAM-dependent methyltransferase [Deltaproteobacteria bacterium]
MSSFPVNSRKPTTSKDHEKLSGAAGQRIRHRGFRIDRRQFAGELTCSFCAANRELDSLAVLDAGEFGLGFKPPPGLNLVQGERLESFQIQLGGQMVFRGEAEVVYQSLEIRVGVQFVKNYLDVVSLTPEGEHRRDRTGRAAQKEFNSQVDVLSADYRAMVADFRVFLVTIRDHLARLERERDWADFSHSEIDELNKELWSTWGEAYMNHVEGLQQAVESMPAQDRVSAWRYGAALVARLLSNCPMHDRAFTKPRGYSGDYILMAGYFDRTLEGRSLFANFLRHSVMHHTTAKSVFTREAALRRILKETVTGDRPLRIMSIACGPAMEVQRFLAETNSIETPVEFLLIDQDEEALEYCTSNLGRSKSAGHPGSRIDFKCLNIAVGQILAPKNASEQSIVDNVLRDADLIYCTGLFDYLSDKIAIAMASRMYGFLKPGGRVLIGNLRPATDSQWILNIGGWHLVYRELEEMKNLAAGMKPKPASLTVFADDSEYCLFLDVKKPA